MRRTALFLLVSIALAALAPRPAASAEPRPPRPYQPVAVTLPPAFEDASLEAFRKELAAVARGRLYADLARLAMPQAVFWDRDFARGYDPRKAPVDNLAAALRLEHHGGAGWLALAAFAAETSAEPMLARPGVICTPALPTFDEIAFDRLLTTSVTEGRDWLYPRADKTAVRATPQPGAATIDTLAVHFIRLLGFEKTSADADDPAPARNLWAKVATPSGKTGYIAPDSLVSLDTERLCYGKDALGHWRIAGFIGRGE